MSAVARIIDAVIDAGLAPAALAGGFRKHARTFRCRSMDAILVTNVQASGFNSGSDGRFTINSASTFPHAFRPLPARSPSRPSEADCVVRRRIGHLMPVQRDHWWEVNADVDATRLAEEVAAAWRDHGLPWLVAHSQLEAVACWLENTRQLFPAIQLRLAQGRTGDAAGLLARFLADERTVPEHRSYVATWAQQHELLPRA